LAEGTELPLSFRPIFHDANARAGYKEYQTGRRYMAKEGDWRDNKDLELELDGIGGVNILVKADVHRSGTKILSHSDFLGGPIC